MVKSFGAYWRKYQEPKFQEATFHTDNNAKWSYENKFSNGIEDNFRLSPNKFNKTASIIGKLTCQNLHSDKD